MREKNRIIGFLILMVTILSWGGCSIPRVIKPNTVKTDVTPQKPAKKLKSTKTSALDMVQKKWKISSSKPTKAEKKRLDELNRNNKFITEIGKKPGIGLIAVGDRVKPNDNKTGKKSKPDNQKKILPHKKKKSLKNVVLNFDNAEIYEVIKTIAGILNLNYLIDPGVKGTVNIHTKGKILNRDLFDILQEILKINGATMVSGDNLYKIVPTQNVKKRVLVPFLVQEGGEIPTQNSVILQIVYLDYISATEAANAVRPFLTQGAEIIIHERSNLLLITDFSRNVEKLLKIIKLLDVNVFERSQIKIFTLEKADVEDVVQEIQKVFTALDIPSSGGNVGGVNFIPIKRMNSLLVITARPGAFIEVEKWLKKLDQNVATEARTYIYHVKNGIAGELSDILNAVFVQGNRDNGSNSGKGRAEALVKNAGSKNKNAKESISRLLTPQSHGSISADIKVIPYTTTNSIIIKATPRDYRVVLEVLAELDTLQRQVLIDVVIAEVTLSDDISFGIQAASRGREIQFGGNAVQRNLVGASLGLTAPGVLALGGLTASTIQGDFFGVLNALASDNKVNILASPHIIAADGKEATIDIGDEVPLIASRIFVDQRQELTIERRNTGTILKVNPHINATGLVTLDVSLELSSAAGAAVEGESDIRIFKRRTNTTMVVQDGQTILIGGLIDEKSEEIKTKIPLLGDIPFLGALFRNTRMSKRKTELILLITPHVIRTIEEASDFTAEIIDGLGVVLREQLYDKGVSRF